MRLFIAIKLSRKMTDDIEGVCRFLRGKGVSGRYTPTESLHLTLAFIGEYDRPDDVLAAMEDVWAEQSGPLRIRLNGSGCWGDLCWIGADGEPGLNDLVKHLRDELRAMLCLEGMQAGLSWLTIIRKEAAIREAFDDFDINKVSAYDEEKVRALLQNPDIIRSKSKINAAVTNAQAVQRLIASGEFRTLDEYVWHFTSGRRIIHRLNNPADTPAKNELSERVSRDMKKRGFSGRCHTS